MSDLTRAAIFNAQLQQIPLSHITTDRVALRDTVNKEAEEWPKFVQSIRTKGVLEPIQVRPNPEFDSDLPASEDNPEFIIINGFHRYTACLEVCESDGISVDEYTIPASVHRPKSGLEVMILQTVTNASRIETKPAQYAAQIQRMMAQDLTLTQSKVAELLDWSESRVSQVLSLKHLPDEAKTLLDNGTITLVKGLALAKLAKVADEDEITEGGWLNRAQEHDTEDFVMDVNSRIDKLRAKNRQERQEQGFQPTTKIRRKPELERELTLASERVRNLGITDENIGTINTDSADFLAGRLVGIQWCMSLDADSVEEQEAAHLARTQEALAKKTEKEREKQQKKALSKGISNPVGIKGDTIPTGFADEGEDEIQAAEARPVNA